jgi:hypothetical protein
MPACDVISRDMRERLPVSGRDRDTTISGEPLQYSTKSWDPSALVTTLMRCSVDENWNWCTSAISDGSYGKQN